MDVVSIDGILFQEQSAGQAYSITEIDPSSYTFEVKAGDFWSGDTAELTNRAELSEGILYQQGQRINVSYGFELAPGAANQSAWVVIGQFNQTSLNGNSPPFAIGLTGEHMTIRIAYENASGNLAYDTIYQDPNNIVRGHEYDISISVEFNAQGGGSLEVIRDGSVLVNYSGSLGYNGMGELYWKEGIYREASTDTLTATFSDLSISTSSSVAGSPPPTSVSMQAPASLADAAIAHGFVGAVGNAGAQVLTGVAAAGATITVFDGAAQIGTTTAGSNGLFSYTLGALGEGAHSLSATAMDTAGDVSSASAVLSFTVDTRPPAAPTSLADGAIHAGFVDAAGDAAAQVVTGAAEAGATVAIFDGAIELGTTAANAQGVFSYTLGQLADGAHSLTAVAADEAGNVGAASAALTFTVDVHGLTFTGSDAADGLVGGPGDDLIIGGGGGDTLTGGAGADTFKYLAATDSTSTAHDTITDFLTGVDVIDLSAVAPSHVSEVYGGDGSETLFIATPGGDMQIAVIGVIQASDILTGSADTPFSIVGDDHGDTLIGGAGADVIVGGAGNDVIIGGGGADSLTGGAGADTFKYLAASDSTASGYDIIQDFQHGVDAIDLTAVAPTYISLVHSGGATYLFPATPGGNMEIAAIGDVEGTDLITGAPVNLYLVADDNGDTLIGGAANDSLHGGAGNDVIIGGGAADALFGGAGADTFKYLAPSDSTPQAYDIIQDFATGVDKLDLTALTPTNVSILHYNGGTFINGVGTNNEVFQIASIHDINAPDIIGLTSGAYIVGDTLGDTLIGGSFAETIVGGTGNDVIIGGGGADALYGGGGTNVFRYLAASDSTTSAPDIIHDFVSGTDKIDLTAVHAGSSSASYGLAFTATGSYLYVDTNGDGMNDMLIEVASPSLHATDILW